MRNRPAIFSARRRSARDSSRIGRWIGWSAVVLTSASRPTLRRGMENTNLRAALHRGLVIPACPLALNAQRTLDERRQRALVRYYSAAGAGGLAVGVHTTQFAIRDPKVGLLEPVLTLAAEE